MILLNVVAGPNESSAAKTLLHGYIGIGLIVYVCHVFIEISLSKVSEIYR